MVLVTENYVPKANRYYIFSFENGMISNQKQEFETKEQAETKYKSLVTVLKTMGNDMYKSLKVLSGKELKKLLQ